MGVHATCAGVDGAVHPEHDDQDVLSVLGPAAVAASPGVGLGRVHLALGEAGLSKCQYVMI